MIRHRKPKPNHNVFSLPVCLCVWGYLVLERDQTSTTTTRESPVCYFFPSRSILARRLTPIARHPFFPLGPFVFRLCPIAIVSYHHNPCVPGMALGGMCVIESRTKIRTLFIREQSIAIQVTLLLLLLLLPLRHFDPRQRSDYAMLLRWPIGS